MTIITRRGMLGGLLSALAAPAIVHAENLMPVRVLREVILLPEPMDFIEGSPVFESYTSAFRWDVGAVDRNWVYVTRIADITPWPQPPSTFEILMRSLRREPVRIQ